MNFIRKQSIPHELRTADEPRQKRLYPAFLSNIQQVNPNIKLLHLTVPVQGNDQEPSTFTFKAGQWLDVHIPNISQAGGFTITSTPDDAKLVPSTLSSPGRTPYVELAVQESPANPPAIWLWRPNEEIIGKELRIRVGGNFVWPPSGLDIHDIRNIVLVAGGVGINPIISILSHLHSQAQMMDIHTHLLYSTRLPSCQETESALDHILFLPRLRQFISSQLRLDRLHISLELFITNTTEILASDLKIHPRRITDKDIYSAIMGSDGKVDPNQTVSYICGPPAMTDRMVELAKDLLGERVFYEKWW